MCFRNNQITCINEFGSQTPMQLKDVHETKNFGFISTSVDDFCSSKIIENLFVSRIFMEDNAGLELW